MQFGDIIIIIIFVGIGISAFAILYNKKIGAKTIEAKNLMDKNRQTITVFVIDKAYTRPTPKNTPKIIYDKISKVNKIRKVGIVRAKFGAKVLTFMTDKDVYNLLPLKKNVKVEVAGLYIIKIFGINLSDKKKKSLREKFVSSTMEDK